MEMIWRIQYFIGRPALVVDFKRTSASGDDSFLCYVMFVSSILSLSYVYIFLYYHFGEIKLCALSVKPSSAGYSVQMKKELKNRNI